MKSAAEINKLISTVQSYTNLEYNWDSYEAEKISTNNINNAIKLITLLSLRDIAINSVFPMVNGGVALNKSFNEYDIEIEILDNKISLLIYDYGMLSSLNEYDINKDSDIEKCISEIKHYTN